MFDTLMYAKRLEAAGMSREQAEAQVNIIAEMVVDGVATKQDLAIQSVAIQKEFAELRLEFASFRSEVIDRFHKQTIQTGMMIAASTTLTIAVLMYFR